MKSNRKSAFDCVAFKHEAQERIYRQTRCLSLEEQIRYFAEKAQGGKLVAWWKAVKAAQSPAGAAAQRRRKSA